MLLQKVLSLCVLSDVSALFATRYWDCCKPHCSWTANTGGITPMPACNKANVTITNANQQSACNSATADNAYTCYNNIPIRIDDNNAIGFAAVPVPPGATDVCGKCYKLTFTGAGQHGTNAGATALKNKVMIVQATNIGYDVAHEQFDIQIPGGGVGAFDACTSQWGVSNPSVLGAQYGGFLTACQQIGGDYETLKTCVRNKCNSIFNTSALDMLKQGCLWYIDWFQMADNPVLTSEEVACPTALTTISGLVRTPPPPTAPTTSAPTPVPGTCPPISGCGCDWANAGTCGTNDGTTCNTMCCCRFRTTTVNLCANGVQDSGELGVDCGGTCTTPCAFCATTNCGANGVCDAANSRCNCINGYTGTFCSTPPNLCPNNKCQPHGTCAASTGVCSCINDYRGNLCEIAPTCSDGIKNQQEIQIDCGGPCSTACVGFEWSTGAWTDCSKPCGGGEQTRSVTCVDAQGNPSASGCDTLHPAVTKQACNPDVCPTYTWASGNWETCSQPCGGGSQTRTVECRSSVGMSVVTPTLCPQNNIPPSAQPCNAEQCTGAYWATDAWSTCTAACGSGTQNRTVTCMDPNLTPVAPAASASSCTAAKPATEQNCNIVPCQTFRWLACEWEECTAQCNSKDGMLGTQSRLVLCVNDKSEAVDASLCPNATMPATLSLHCSSQPCTTPNWMANGPWSACVNGVRTRSFHCHNADGSNAEDSVCLNGVGAQPAASEQCVLNACPSMIPPVVGPASSWAPSLSVVILLAISHL